MRALVRAALEQKVKAYNPEHSFVVTGVGGRRIYRCISQMPGVRFAPKRDRFTYRGVVFSFGDGGDMGGDGLWIITEDGLPHPDELRVIRKEVERMIEVYPPSKGTEIMTWLGLIGALMVCVGVCFATLHTVAALPPWSNAAISIPVGVCLFYIACKCAA